jgi:hypothetical protein
MAMNVELAKELRLDERNHVEKPLLDLLHGLDWRIKRLDRLISSIGLSSGLKRLRGRRFDD